MTVSVFDGGGGIDSIDVEIKVLNVREAPNFTDGNSTTRAVAENTTAGQNIGTAVAATDGDGDTVTYTLSGTDAASFSIVSTTGQLQTKAALDFESKASYSVTITASDDSLTDDSLTGDIDVTINVIDVDEPGNDQPTFTEGSSTTRLVMENTASGQNIGTAVAATDSDTGDVLAYTLGGTDAAAFRIVSTTGQLQTNAVIDFETKSSYSVTVSVSDGNNGSDSIAVTINVTLRASARSAPMRDAIANVLGTTDVSSAQLATITTLDLSNKNISSLQAGDFSGLTELTVLKLQSNSITDISHLRGLTNLTWLRLDNNSITDLSALSGMTKLRSLRLDNNSITDLSALSGMTKLASLAIRGNSGISNYSPVKILMRDHKLTLIDIVLPNDAPVFTDGSSTTRSVAEDATSGTNIGDPVAATDVDNDTLIYSLSGTDTSSFSIVNISGQLQTNVALDFEIKTSYSVNITVSDGSLTDSIDVTINITDIAGAAPSLIPANTALLTNFPNPFNPETWIPYQLAKPAEVTLTIYNMRGVVVRRLKLGHQPAGVYHSRSRAIHWDGRNRVGEKVASGIYFYTLTAGDYAATRKLLILK